MQLLSFLNLAFAIYKDPEKALSFGKWLFFSFLIGTTIMLFFLSAEAYRFDIHAKGNDLLHAFGVFLGFICLSVFGAILSVTFYKDFKKPNSNLF